MVLAIWLDLWITLNSHDYQQKLRMRLLKIAILLLVVLPFIAGVTPLLPLTTVIGQINQLNPPPAPAGNPVTTSKANLGKVLFWDEQLSSTKTVACGSCHHALNGGADPRSVSQASRSVHPGVDGVFGNTDDMIGSMGVPLTLADGTFQWSPSFGFKEQVTGRRSMSSINAAYSSSLFWDGRALQVFRDPITNAIVLASGAALESQVLGPPVNSTEMGHVGRDWNDVAKRVAASKPLALCPSVPTDLMNWINSRSYLELFSEAFGAPEVTPTRIAMAIATYERTLYSNQTPFDTGSLTAAEARGQQVFNQNDCNDCHTGTLFTDNLFHNTGIRPSAEDQGLFVVTGNQNDLAKFRTPSLRNVELRAPYMHNGRFATLEEVVEFYNRGGDVNAANIERNRVRPRNLSAQQKADLVAFMKRPLTDPRVASETAPFDRPMLYAESLRVPQITGTGVAGTGGIVPQVTALAPPIIGNTNFTVGVTNALGGAQAILVIDKNDPGGSIPNTASLARVTTTLSGGGYGSVSLTIPNDSALIGVPLYGRWYINDSAAVGGMAISPAFQMNIFGSVVNAAPAIATVSAASYIIGAVAPESIVSGFGTNFAVATAAANSLPLPETLAGVQILIRDVLGVERAAPLLYVSPTQLNYQVPAGLATGEGSVTVRQSGNIVAVGLLQITSITPGLFAIEANGHGPAAAQAQRVQSDNAQSFEPVASFDAAQNRAITIPLDLSPVGDQVYLVLYGTGIRLRSGLANVSASVGGTILPLAYAGAQGNFVGVDQANVLLPRTLIGRGEVDVILTVDGKISNAVRISFK